MSTVDTLPFLQSFYIDATTYSLTTGALVLELNPQFFISMILSRSQVALFFPMTLAHSLLASTILYRFTVSFSLSTQFLLVEFHR